MTNFYNEGFQKSNKWLTGFYSMSKGLFGKSIRFQKYLKLDENHQFEFLEVDIPYRVLAEKKTNQLTSSRE